MEGLPGPFVLGLGENGQTGIVTKALVIMKKWRNARSQDLLLLLIQTNIVQRINTNMITQVIGKNIQEEINKNKYPQTTDTID